MAGTRPLWTIFGDAHGNFPGLYNTGQPGNHVRTYIAGIFDADTTFPDVPNDKIRCGVVIQGNASSATVKVVVNGAIRFNITTGAITKALADWETAYYGAESDVPLAGILDYFYVDYGYDQFYMESTYPPVEQFDTRDCKLAWYVDQSTGYGDGVLAPDDVIYAYPMMMYTPPEPPGSFSWDTHTATEGATEDISFYDVDSSVVLNVNLGGHTASWTYDGVDVPQYYGVYYLLGYPSTPPTGDFYIDGGIRFVEPSTSAGYLDTWGSTETFLVTGDRAAAYFAPDQTADAPVASAGLRQYPGISASHQWINGFIEALNFGRPVLYEQWYSTTIPGEPVSFWTQRVRTTEVI